MTLGNYDPETVLFSDTAETSSLFETVKDNFEFAVVETFRRKYFNESEGLAYIERHGVPNSTVRLGVGVDGSSKYLCLAASACLMRYVEFTHSLTLATRSLLVTFRSLDGFMKINAATVASLELVHSRATSKAAARGATLFSVLNRCSTSLGARCLRQNLLQPLTDLPTILTRQDAITEMLGTETLYWELVRLLPEFAEFDRTNAQIVREAKVSNEGAMERTVQHVMLLKKMLQVLPSLSGALSKSENPVFQLVAEKLGEKVTVEQQLQPTDRDGDVDVVAGGDRGSRATGMDERLVYISTYLSECIDKVVDPEATFSKRSTNVQARRSVVFAIRPCVSSHLDLARATFEESLEDLDKLVEQMQQELQVPSLKLMYSSGRGFHLCASADQINQQDPAHASLIVQPVRKGRRLLFTTEAVSSLNDRQHNTYVEVLGLAERALQALLSEIRDQLPYLYRAAESIALVDMLHALATYVTTCDISYCPKFVEDTSAPIAIQLGRHPVLERMLEQSSFVPNNTFLNEQASLQIVSGPNASGKSCYLSQVGLLTVLAHIGSYVPAQFASFRVTDQIFTRMSMGDDLEGNSGSFLCEMREVSFILEKVTNNSLVLIDELGRGSSTVEGVGIAWAVCERLATHSKAYALCATHFTELCDLPQLYSNVKNISMQVRVSENRISYLFSLAEGSAADSSADAQDYGIFIAEIAGFPDGITQPARAMSQKLREQYNERIRRGGGGLVDRTSNELLTRLASLKHSTLSAEAKLSWLKGLQSEFRQLERDRQNDFEMDEC